MFEKGSLSVLDNSTSLLRSYATALIGVGENEVQRLFNNFHFSFQQKAKLDFFWLVIAIFYKGKLGISGSLRLNQVRVKLEKFPEKVKCVCTLPVGEVELVFAEF